MRRLPCRTSVCALAIVLALTVHVGAAHAGASASAAPPPFTLSLGAEHPLAGRVFAMADGREIGIAALFARLGQARLVILGEKHDNPDHHRLQAFVLASLTEQRPIGVVMEMIRTDAAPALARQLDAAPLDADGVATAVDWAKSGWPDFGLYRPVVAAALDQPALTALAPGLRLRAGDLPRERMRQAMKDLSAAAGGPDRLAALGLDRKLPDAAATALARSVRDGHCGLLPEPAVPGMAGAQRLRDATLAQTSLDLLAALDDWRTRQTPPPEPPAVALIAGNGHARRDYGAPWYAAPRLGSEAVAVLAFVEATPEIKAAADGMPTSAPDGRPAYDFIWFTPRVDDEDPCAKHAQVLKGMGGKKP